MPANRSRTAGWRQCLSQIKERGGSLELAVARSTDSCEEQMPRRDLLVRCRVLDVGPTGIRVEAPMTLGTVINIPVGVHLIAMMAVGQNRWLFRTACSRWVPTGAQGRPEMLLAIPERVDRCQRRRDYRVETASLDLPDVELWPLLDPSSVVLAERVNAAAFLRELDAEAAVDPPLAELRTACDEGLLPEVGPGFPARLVNLGGGGVGVTVDDAHAGSIGRQTLFWMRFGLPPMLETPVCAVARVVHSHMQSDRQTYAGMTFDFSANPAHKRIVVGQIVRAIACQQKRQMSREAVEDRHRRGWGRQPA